MKHNHFLHILISILIAAVFIQCNDTEILESNKGELYFSSDTISFDTIFTDMGSTTKSLKVVNNSGEKMLISSINIENENSFFLLNVDGIQSNKLSNFEVMPNDSFFVFIQLNVNPLNENNPVFIEDSINFTINKAHFAVKLHAYGQDVKRISSAFLENTTWTAEKPYFLLDSMVILPGATLTIEEGTTIYCYKDAVIYSLGNIVANGTAEKPIVLRGHRLDEIWEGYQYDHVSEQWGGIQISPSELKSSFKHCTIKNAIFGLFIGEFGSEQKTHVNIENTVIHNNSYAGLVASYSNITMKNSQITNSGIFNVLFTAGGNYNVYHCTISNYYGQDYNAKRNNKTTSLILSNSDIQGDYVYYFPLENANFYNCIIDGNLESELILQSMDGVDFNFGFYNCAIKADKSLIDNFSQNFSNCYFNDTIQYLSLKQGNYIFSPDTNSVVIDKGNIDYVLQTTNLETDLLGNSRIIDEKPDLGAYEFFINDTTETTRE